MGPDSGGIPIRLIMNTTLAFDTLTFRFVSSGNKFLMWGIKFLSHEN